jgi:hypothetical protein
MQGTPPKRQPSLAELLLMQGTYAQTGVGIPTPSIDPSGDGWFSANDFPSEVRKVVMSHLKPGVVFGGISIDKVTDPAQKQLLMQWITAGQRERDARMAERARTDPKFAEELRLAQASGNPEEE